MASLPLVNFVPVHQVSTITAGGANEGEAVTQPLNLLAFVGDLDSSVILKGFYVQRFLLMLTKCLQIQTYLMLTRKHMIAIEVIYRGKKKPPQILRYLCKYTQVKLRSGTKHVYTQHPRILIWVKNKASPCSKTF